MLQLALLITGRCGFGFSFTWLEPPRSADGKMAIQHALHTIVDHFLAVPFVPKWIERLWYVKQQVFILQVWFEYMINFIGRQRS